LDITLQERQEIDLYGRFLEPGQWREVNISRQWILYINAIEQTDDVRFRSLHCRLTPCREMKKRRVV